MMMMMQSLPSSVGGNMKTAAHHRGSLKQQCIDEHGLYTWQKKDFLLYIDQGKLDIRSPGDGEDDLLASTATVSLQGARYAKEWSFSSALAGYGFDILWVSGKIWSFLVDNEADCLQWVGVLNQAIQRCNEDFGHVPSALPVASTTTTAGSPEAAMSPSRPGQSKPKATYESHKEYLSHLASSQSYGTNEDDTRNISFSIAPQLGLSVDTTTANFSHNNNNLYRSRSQSPSHHRNPNESILLNTMPISGKNRYREVNEDEAISGVAMRASRDFYDDMPRLNVMASPPPPPPNSYSSVDAAATAHNFSMMMNISEIPRSNQSQIDSGSETGSIQPPYNTATNNYMPPLSSKKSSLTGYDTIPASPKAGIPKVTTTDNTPRSSGEYVEHMKSIFANTKQTLYNAEQSLHQYPPLASTRLMPASSVQSSSMDAQINAEIAWQIKCGQLEQMLQEREGNYHQLEDDFQSMQQDYQQQIQSLQQQLTVVQQREQAISEKFNEQVQDRMLRLSNENNHFYDSHVKNIQLQHERELSLLQEELKAERVKSIQQLEKEVALRKRVESQESDWKQKYQQAQDRLLQVDMDYKALSTRFEDLQSQSQRDQRRYVHDFQQQIASLTHQLHANESQFQVELQQQYQSLQHKYSTSLQAMKDKEMTLLTQNLQQEQLHNLLSYQKKCEVDIETIRHEEAKRLVLEVEKVRQQFLQREQSLANDVMELEKLHAMRVQQLEEKLKESQQRQEDLQQSQRQQILQQDRQQHDWQYQLQQLTNKQHDTILQVDHYQREVQSLQQMIEEKTMKEIHYREELTKALTELRVLQAEKHELSSQSSQEHAKAMQWKQVLEENQHRYSSIDTTIKIREEENTMLVHENSRLKQENCQLRDELDKADRLIYGVPQHRVDSKKSMPTKIEPSMISQLHLQHQQHQQQQQWMPSTPSSQHTSFSSPNMTPNTYIPQHSTSLVDFIHHNQSFNSVTSSAKKTASSSGNSHHKKSASKSRSSSPSNFDPYRLTISKAAKLPVSQSTYNPDQNMMQNLLKSKQFD